MRDLYTEAAETGKRLSESEGPLSDSKGGFMSHEDRVVFWAARHAARETSMALLLEARRIGVTDAQWEALRVVAAEVSYD